MASIPDEITEDIGSCGFSADRGVLSSGGGLSCAGCTWSAARVSGSATCSRTGDRSSSCWAPWPGDPGRPVAFTVNPREGEPSCKGKCYCDMAWGCAILGLWDTAWWWRGRRGGTGRCGKGNRVSVAYGARVSAVFGRAPVELDGCVL